MQVPEDPDGSLEARENRPIRWNSENPMARSIMLISCAGAVIFLGLAYLPDPGVLGIRSEPSRILFYASAGLLAGLCAIVSLVSGVVFAVGRLLRGRGQS